MIWQVNAKNVNEHTLVCRCTNIFSCYSEKIPKKSSLEQYGWDIIKLDYFEEKEQSRYSNGKTIC